MGIRLVCAAAALAALVAGARPARGACRALETDQPTRADLERCLSSRPLIVSSVGLNLTVGGDTGQRGTLFATVDVPVLRPLWISARARAGSGYGDFDLLGGVVLRARYGRGVQRFTLVSNTYHSPAATGYAYTQTATVHAADVVQRGALLLLAGTKGVSRTLSGDTEPSLDLWKTWQAGLAFHHANHKGSHARVEAFVVTRGGKWGGVLTWHNSVPSMGRWVVGMEVGYVPVAAGAGGAMTTHTFYWNLIDLGISFEL